VRNRPAFVWDLVHDGPGLWSALDTVAASWTIGSEEDGLAAVRKSAVSSTSIGTGGRGGGMSAAARARASVSSSSGGTSRSVWWRVFGVLGFVMGS